MSNSQAYAKGMLYFQTNDIDMLNFETNDIGMLYFQTNDIGMLYVLKLITYM